MPARGEAPSLGRAELVAAGEGEDGRLDQPWPRRQPRRRVDELVEARRRRGTRPGRRPARRATNDPRNGTHVERRPARSRAAADSEHAHRRQARRQHHGHDHDEPAGQEDRDGEPQGWATLDERVMMERRRGAGRPAGPGAISQAPPISDRHGTDGRQPIEARAGLPPRRRMPRPRSPHTRSRLQPNGRVVGTRTSRPASRSSMAFRRSWLVTRSRQPRVVEPALVAQRAARGRARRRGTCRSAPYALATCWPSSTRYGKA